MNILVIELKVSSLVLIVSIPIIIKTQCLSRCVWCIKNIFEFFIFISQNFYFIFRKSGYLKGENNFSSKRIERKIHFPSGTQFYSP